MNIWKALIHVIVPVIAAIIINVVIYVQGWNSDSEKDKKTEAKYLPPGYVIAIVWVIILALLGFTHYLVYPSFASFAIIFAIIYCLAYPFLTSGLQAYNAGFYNVLSFVIAILISVFVFMENKMATLYTIPFLLWTGYVSIITLL
jgi:tryptophan-rich sensory protein